MMNPLYNRHYILIDTQNRITDGWSDGPHPEKDVAGALCINEQGGYQFRLAPDGEENPPLFTFEGVPLYKWDGGQVLLREKTEIDMDIAAIPSPPPTEMEQLRADIDFISVMAGIEL